MTPAAITPSLQITGVTSGLTKRHQRHRSGGNRVLSAAVDISSYAGTS